MGFLISSKCLFFLGFIRSFLHLFTADCVLKNCPCCCATCLRKNLIHRHILTLCGTNGKKRKYLQKAALFTTSRKKLLSWKTQGSIEMKNTIKSLSGFLKGHFTAINANNGNPTFLPYLERLMKLKEFLSPSYWEYIYFL